ncbi:hypothetical protein B0H12DRAFT_1150880 [Mycena haematopus]|nr:hypothetical protein B0H12DRAFT_1150880 [Mycena haematopus]
MAPAEYSGSDTLHWVSNDTHVLFSFIQLDHVGGFVLGGLFTVAICLLERILTSAFESRWAPASIQRLRTANALWRAGLYWVLALLRLAYMLIAMSLNAGLILIAVTTLALGQFFIELRTPPRGADHDYAPLGETPMYLESTSDSASKPEGIFVNATQSNGAPDTARYAHEAPAAWEAGTGSDVARSLLGHKKRASLGSRRGTQFQLGGGEGRDSGDSGSDS